mmetsp:Transcript_118982/g.370618  ORF Transcript_118982/g.370618 Transcript_118982/m.370618 type:complete len:250 (-) Transcript_118982:13-762(-)
MQETRVVTHTHTNQLGALCLSLCIHNLLLSLLFSLLDNELRTLGLLLRHLLGLHCSSVLTTETEVRDGDIFKHNIEIARTLNELRTDQPRDTFALSDQLRRIELRNNGLENFIDNRRKNSLIVVNAEISVDFSKMGDVGTCKHTQCDIDHLQIFASRKTRDASSTSTDVVGGGNHEPRYSEMHSFAVNPILHTVQAVEHDRAMSTLHCKERFIDTVRESAAANKKSGTRTKQFGNKPLNALHSTFRGEV